MQNYLSKKIAMLVLMSLTMIGLTGCASFTEHQNIKTRCATNRLLITDLSQRTPNHRAMLPDGQLCVGEVL